MPQLLVPIFTAILPAAVAGATIGGVTVASLLATITFGVISVAVMMLLAPKPKKPEDGHIAIQQAVPPRIFAYGKARVAGYIALLEENNGSLFHISALCAHKINAVVGYFLNDDVVTVDSSKIVVQLYDSRYGESSIRLDHRLGEPTETAYGYVSELYPLGLWGETYRGDGVASLMMTCAGRGSDSFYGIYPVGRPMPSAEIEAAILYDPRTDVWEYSDNTALEIIHFLCFSEFGPQRSYDECIAPVVDKWKSAADICDEQVMLRAGGSEKRYRSGGFDTTEHDTRTVLNELLASCDGWLCERGDGTIILTVGKYDEPTYTITDDDIIGWTIQSDVPDEYAVNEIATTFCFVDANYSTTSVDPWEDTEDQALRGSKRSIRLELPWVQSFSQARRLGKRELYRQRQKIRGQLILNFGAFPKIHGRFVNVKSNYVPFLSDAVIENRKAVISLQSGSISVDYIGSGPDIDDWSPETDEGTAPIAPTTSSTSLLAPPSNVNVVVEEVDKSSYVDVSFDTPSYSGVTYVVRWRYSASGSWVETEFKNSSVSSGGRTTLTLSTVPQNASIDVDMCNIGTRGTRTAFSDPITVSTVIATAAPGSPVNGSATGWEGQAVISWYNANSSTLGYSEVFRGGATDPFSLATLVSGKIYGAANQNNSYTDTVVAGSYAYWIVSYSTSGSPSSPSGPFTVTVT